MTLTYYRQANTTQTGQSATPSVQYAPGFEEPLEEIDKIVDLSRSYILPDNPTSDEPDPNISERSVQQQEYELRQQIAAGRAELDRAAADGRLPAELLARKQQEFDSYRTRYALGSLSMIGKGNEASWIDNATSVD